MLFTCSFNGSTDFTGLNAVETSFSEELIAYWLSFVRAKNPNTFRLARSPEWPAFAAGQRVVLQQDPGNLTARSGVVSEQEDPANEVRCGFIASLVDHMQD